MSRIESLEDFYQRKFGWLPDNYKSGLGHFNIFRLEPFVGENAHPVPYKRRDFYKIMFVKGRSHVHYADKSVEVKRQALSFSNPQIPYKWEHLETVTEGMLCIFNQHFFHQFGNLNQYSVFQPGGVHLFELNDALAEQIHDIYKKMFEEFNSNYMHKYDVLRNHVYELLHFAMKLQPSVEAEQYPMNASQRISTLFLELLERQFPIDENHQSLELRTASDYAKQLNVHVNHLNHSVKEATDKTTSQIIGERVAQEAKMLLRHSSWSVSEIAFALGFNAAPHFNQFFRKHTDLTPTQFRSHS